MATTNNQSPPFKLVEFGEGDWKDWYFEQQQLMIVAHVSVQPTPDLLTGLEFDDTGAELNI